MTGYIITWATGETPDLYDSLAEARERVEESYPDAEGHASSFGGEIWMVGDPPQQIAEIHRAGKPTKIVIELEIVGFAVDAMIVVNDLLEHGLLQDEINSHDNENAGPLKVRSAVARFADDEGGS